MLFIGAGRATNVGPGSYADRGFALGGRGLACLVFWGPSRWEEGVAAFGGIFPMRFGFTPTSTVARQPPLVRPGGERRLGSGFELFVAPGEWIRD
jgi:hypothetical protein